MTNQDKELRNKISEILVKWNMPTRQVAISEIMFLLAAEREVERSRIIKKILPPFIKLIEALKEQYPGLRDKLDEILSRIAAEREVEQSRIIKEIENNVEICDFIHKDRLISLIKKE